MVTLLVQNQMIYQAYVSGIFGRDPGNGYWRNKALHGLDQGHEIPYSEYMMLHEYLKLIYAFNCPVQGVKAQFFIPAMIIGGKIIHGAGPYLAWESDTLAKTFQRPGEYLRIVM